MHATEDGTRIAVFYAKVHNRILIPLTTVDQPQAPPRLRNALVTIARRADQSATQARLPRAAREPASTVKNLATKDR